MKDSEYIHKTRIVAFILSAFVLAFSAFLLINSGVIKGLSKSNDEARQKLFFQASLTDVQEGIFYDRNGKALTAAQGVGTPGKVLYKDDSYLIGYASKIYSCSGLRKKFSEYLYDGGHDDKGADITLTIQQDIQDYAYDLVKNKGSMCIVDNQTGAIIAQVSRPGKDRNYDCNKIDDKWDKWQEGEFLLDRNLIAGTPGSDFKALTAACAIQNDLKDYTYKDDGAFLGIHNSGNVSYGKLGIQKALIKSVNTYFASLGVKLGSKALKSTYEAFYVGKDIETDQGTLSSNLSFKEFSDSDIAQVAFGQGDTKVSPLQMAAIYGAIANGGTLYTPYIVASIDNDNKNCYKGQTNELGKPLTKAESKDLKELLKGVAEEYGLTKKSCGVTCYAKTGTAELSEKDHYNKIWLCTATDRYTIVFSYDETSKGSHSLIASMKKMIKYMEKHYK